MVGVLGLLMMGYTGYRDFQDGIDKDVADLRTRVAVLESDSVQHEKRLDRLSEWLGHEGGSR